MKRHMLTISLVILGLCVLGVSASAQTFPQDVFKINYFANNVSAAPDQTVRIDNPGNEQYVRPVRDDLSVPGRPS